MSQTEGGRHAINAPFVLPRCLRMPCKHEEMGLHVLIIKGCGYPRVVFFGGLSSAVMVRMKLFRVFFVFILLGGDYGFEPASLEAFPQQLYGRSFTPVQPFLLCHPHFSGWVTLLIFVGALLLRGALGKGLRSLTAFLKSRFV